MLCSIIDGSGDCLSEIDLPQVPMVGDDICIARDFASTVTVVKRVFVATMPYEGLSSHLIKHTATLIVESYNIENQSQLKIKGA